MTFVKSQSRRVNPVLQLSPGVGGSIFLTTPIPLALVDDVPEVGLIPRNSVLALPVVLEVGVADEPITLESDLDVLTVALVDGPLTVELQ